MRNTDKLKLTIYTKGDDIVNTEQFNSNNENIDSFAVETENHLSEMDDNLLKHTDATGNPHNVTKAQVDLGNVDNAKQATKSEFDAHTTDNVKHLNASERNSWNDKYTKAELDNKLSMLEMAVDWKESVATFADIATTYPNPMDGWTVNVLDTDYTYRYTGADWVAISANSIPLATAEQDGKMSKEDKVKLDDSNAKKHEHSNKSVLDGITSPLVTAWNSAVTHVTDAVKHITSSERTLWNTVINKANASDVLTKTNATEFTPTSNYQPATKKYVDENTVMGGGDMLKSVYDPDGDEMVDTAKVVYAKRIQVSDDLNLWIDTDGYFEFVDPFADTYSSSDITPANGPPTIGDFYLRVNRIPHTKPEELVVQQELIQDNINWTRKRYVAEGIVSWTDWAECNPSSYLTKYSIVDKAISLHYSESVGADNLDWHETGGCYTNGNNGNQQILNCPTKSAFMMEINTLDTFGVTQRLTDESGQMFFRAKPLNKQWGNWVKFYTDNNLHVATPDTNGLMSSYHMNIVSTIQSNYASSLSVSGQTVTLKNKNGSTLSTITTQDTNTTYGLATTGSNGLMSTSHVNTLNNHSNQLGGFSIQVVTQAQYDASPKSVNIIYLIKA